MIDKRILDALERELNIGVKGIYSRIQKTRKARGFIISREQAAALLASENGIDISKFLSKEELNDLRKLQGQTITVSTKVVQKRTQTQQKIIKLGTGRDVKDNLLPSNIINEASRMSEIYPILYIFENSVRNIISLVLSKRYGDDWWLTKVSKPIRDKVTGRISKESANPWHGKRGSAPIYYTDISHLLSIIRNNWEDFIHILPNQSWIETRINEIEMSRNIVAHNNPLTKRDIQRITLYFEDWENQIKSVKNLI